MTINDGSKMLVQVALDENPGEFLNIAGMRTTRLVYNNQVIDSTNKESGKWREILADVGISSLSISASGIFMNSKSEEIIRANCFERSVKRYRILFASGDIIESDFFISSYERNGNYGEEENYHLTFESSGKVYYTKN